MCDVLDKLQPNAIPKHDRKCGFRKGHAVYKTRTESSASALGAVQESGESLAVWMPRLTEAEFEQVTKVTPGGLIEIPDAEGRSGEAKLLRPKHCAPNANDDDDDLSLTYLKADDTHEEMRLYDKGKMQYMYNECILEHSTQKNMCAIPEFIIAREVKVGLCWQCCLRCTKCGFMSGIYKLYNEIETGKRKESGLTHATCYRDDIRLLWWRLCKVQVQLCRVCWWEEKKIGGTDLCTYKQDEFTT